MSEKKDEKRAPERNARAVHEIPAVRKTIKQIIQEHETLISTRFRIHIYAIVRGSALRVVQVTDASTDQELLLVLGPSIVLVQKPYKGTRIEVKGVLVKPPGKDAKVSYELDCDEFVITGPVREPGTYLPSLTNAKPSMEAWRDKPAERVACPAIALKLKIADFLQHQISVISQRMGAIRADPSEITGMDCEGAGKMFTVTTAVNDDGSLDASKLKPPTLQSLFDFADTVRKHKDVIEMMIEVYGKDHAATKQAQDYLIQETFKSFIGDHVTIDPKKDYFQKSTMAKLTVSSQLGLERLVKQFGCVWTMNKSFRAEQSDTNQHLAECTRFEMEQANEDYQGLRLLIEVYFKHIVMSLLSGYGLILLQQLEKVDPEAVGVIAKLSKFVEKEFAAIPYTEALKLLQKHKDDLRKVFPNVTKIPAFGDDLGQYCERYLAETIVGYPVFITDMPWPLKSFYMKRNMDGQTVQGVDLLVPYMGELVGGSVREESWSQLAIQLIENRLYSIKAIYIDASVTPEEDEKKPVEWRLVKPNHYIQKQILTKLKAMPDAAKNGKDELAKEAHVKQVIAEYHVDFGTCQEYLHLRYNAAVKSAGFGMDFARLVNICTTGGKNTGLIRDTIAEPVAWKSLHS